MEEYRLINALYAYSQDTRALFKSEKHTKQRNIFNTNREKLLAQLQGEEKSQLIAMLEAIEELEWLTIKTEFQEGLRLGMELYSELFKEE